MEQLEKKFKDVRILCYITFGFSLVVAGFLMYLYSLFIENVKMTNDDREILHALERRVKPSQ